MSTVSRVLDANINRAAEGMRVLEDIARFVLEHKTLSASLKQHRHELRGLSQETHSRDAKHDVGTTNKTHLESSRKSLHDVAIAAGNRCTEALRVIEEFLKLSNIPNNVESIRYAMYDLAAVVIQELGSAYTQQWNLCFVMTIDDCVLPWQDTLSQSLVAGCDCVQIREKNISTADLLSHTNKVKDIATRFGAHVVVNDRVDIMMATGIHGVHLGQEDMPITEARKLCGCEFVIGATAHTTDEIDRAVLQGADYVGIGSMFPSNTKPNVPVAPLGLLKHALAYNHLAIGGITQSNAHTLYESGCKGVAVSSAISQSTEPEKIVKNLLQPEHQSA